MKWLSTKSCQGWVFCKGLQLEGRIDGSFLVTGA